GEVGYLSPVIALAGVPESERPIQFERLAVDGGDHPLLGLRGGFRHRHRGGHDALRRLGPLPGGLHDDALSIARRLAEHGGLPRTEGPPVLDPVITGFRATEAAPPWVRRVSVNPD